MTAQIVALLEGLARAQDPRPIVLCEYAHSMGNSTGARVGWCLMGEQLTVMRAPCASRGPSLHGNKKVQLRSSLGSPAYPLAHAGNFRDYWQQFESSPRCAGGFIWWVLQCKSVPGLSVDLACLFCLQHLLASPGDKVPRDMIWLSCCAPNSPPTKEEHYPALPMSPLPNE